MSSDEDDEVLTTLLSVPSAFYDPAPRVIKRYRMSELPELPIMVRSPCCRHPALVTLPDVEEHCSEITTALLGTPSPGRGNRPDCPVLP